jgi:hypothetical protein
MRYSGTGRTENACSEQNTVQSNENICIVAPEGTNKRSIDDIVL